MHTFQTGFHLFEVIVILGMVQAVVMAVLILTRAKKQPAPLLFGAILLTLAVLGIKILLHTLGLWQTRFFHLFPLAIDTLLPVLLYAYLLTVTGEPLSRRRILLYLLPTGLLLLHALLVYGCTLGEPVIALKDRVAERQAYNPVKSLEDGLTAVFSLACWLLGYRQLKRYREWLYRTQSDSRLQEYAWLRNLLVLTGILALIFCCSTWFSAGNFRVVQGFYIYLAGISYYLALKGYALYGQVITGAPVTPRPEAEEPVTLSADQLLIREKILSALENGRLYLRPELSLKELAGHVGYPAGTISAVINQALGQNFRNLVNGYRVNAVKEMLLAPPAHLSLLGIALECGFNSEASFYRIFRQLTGESPNDYLKKINAQKRF